MAKMPRASQDWDNRLAQRVKLRDLHILAAVVRLGGMAKAGVQLSMSQSAVSEAIANLEDALGVRLLDRSPRGVAPTDYAHALLKHGHVIFDELREAVGDIEALAGSTAGEVRVACLEFLAAGVVPDAVERLTRRHPQITAHVVETNVRTLEFRQLHERDIDLMVTRIPNGFAEDDLDIEILFDDPHVVVAGANSRWARERKIGLADLVDAPWINPASLVVDEIFREAFERLGLKVPPAQVTTSFILMRNQLLASGRYLTLLPESVMRYNAKLWSLHTLPIALQVTPRPIALVTLKNRTMRPAVALFIEQLRAVAKMFPRPPIRRGRP
jgi:DNA-binding transcriptional LysR family regulator